MHDDGLQVLNINDPVAPKLVGGRVSPGEAHAVAVAGNYAYIADYGWGLQVFRVSSVVTLDEYTGPGQTSFNDRLAFPGVTYKYSVSAFDSLGEALGLSSPADDLGRRVLLAPTNASADKGRAETEIEITWTDNSNAEDGYRVYRNSLLLGSTEDNFTSYVDISPVLGETNFYNVVAFDNLGESVASSDWVTPRSSHPGRSTRPLSIRTEWNSRGWTNQKSIPDTRSRGTVFLLLRPVRTLRRLRICRWNRIQPIHTVLSL